MKKNAIALLAPVFLLASCAANSTGITRAEARTAIMDSLEDFASSSDEILKSFTAKYRSVDEEGKILLFASSGRTKTDPMLLWTVSMTKKANLQNITMSSA